MDSCPSRPLSSTVVGSYPQPEWLIDRDGARLPLGPARAREPCLAGARGVSCRRRRTTPRWSRSATWSAPGSTRSPTGRCAARATPTGSRPRSTASTPSEPATIQHPRGREQDRAADRRPGALARPGRGARRRVPARQHRPRDQDHPARPVHHGPAGEQRGLRRSRRAGHGPGRRGQRRGARARARRRRRHPARRAVVSQRSCGGPPDRRARRSIALWKDCPVTTAVHLCFGYAALVGEKSANRYEFLGRAERQRRRPGLGRGGPATARPRPAVRPQPQGRRARRARPRRRRRSRARRRSPSAFAPRSRTCRPSASSPRPTAA